MCVPIFYYLNVIFVDTGICVDAPIQDTMKQFSASVSDFVSMMYIKLSINDSRICYKGINRLTEVTNSLVKM